MPYFWDPALPAFGSGDISSTALAPPIQRTQYLSAVPLVYSFLISSSSESVVEHRHSLASTLCCAPTEHQLTARSKRLDVAGEKHNRVD